MTVNLTLCSRSAAALGMVLLIGCVGGGLTDGTVTPYAPAITTQPVSVVVIRGDSARLSVGVTGSGPLSFQWHREGLALVADTTATVFIAAATAADSGAYYVVVTNPVTSVTSATVLVSVVPSVSSTAWRQEGGAGSTTARAYFSSLADESAVYVFGSGVLTMETPDVSKLGASSNLDASRERGQNAALLGTSGSRIYVTGGVVTSDAEGATTLFATGAGTKVTLTGGYVSTLRASSPAVGASDGATVAITGATLSAAVSDAIVVSAASDSAAPVTITVAGGSTVTSGTGTLLRVAKGSRATLTLDSETVTGLVTIDAGSAASVVLQNSTSWTGAMNGGAITLDATSNWSVTAASSLTVLTNPAIAGDTITNIVGNGYTVTYVATLEGNAALGSRTYSLAGGGRLVPR